MFGHITSGGELGPPLSAAVAAAADGQAGSPAGLGRRAPSALIDLVIAFAVVLGPLIALDRILTAVSVSAGSVGTIWLTAAVAWSLAFLLLYSPLSVTLWGGTLGKRLLGIEVIRIADGGRLTYGATVMRHLCNIVVHAVPVFLIPHFSAITLSEKKQGIPDRWVGSAVVMRQR